MSIAQILQTLAAHGVEFVIVGGTAAVLQGAPVHTLDLDVVYAVTPQNVDRLLSALAELNAIFRDDPRKLRPTRSHLESRGHKLLETDHGPLDLLATIEESTGYGELVEDSEWFEVAAVRVRVLSLERLIRVKEQLRRPKDVAMLDLLRATLDEVKKRSR